MISYIKRNKFLSFFVLLTITSFISGIFFYAFIDNNTKNVISNNINLLINNKLLKFNNLYLNNICITTLIWLLGISVIGIFIVIPLFLFKVFLFSFEFISLISNLGLKNIFLILLYLFPNFMIVLICFIICFYSGSYSLYLVRHLFKNINYNMSSITKKYIYIYFISIIIVLFSCLLESVIIPNLQFFLIK